MRRESRSFLMADLITGVPSCSSRVHGLLGLDVYDSTLDPKEIDRPHTTPPVAVVAQSRAGDCYPNSSHGQTPRR